MDAGVALFAEKGFRETTVGDVEAAVGLSPRRGALYRHFPSKEALLQAALEHHLQTIATAGLDLDQTPVVDPRAEAMAVGRWLLAELDRERAIVRILEQEGDRLADLRDWFRRDLVDAGYLAVLRFARRWLGPAAESVDIESVSVVLLGALVNYRRSTWTFGAVPLDLDEERFLSTWAHLCEVTTSSLSQSPGGG